MKTQHSGFQLYDLHWQAKENANNWERNFAINPLKKGVYQTPQALKKKKINTWIGMYALRRGGLKNWYKNFLKFIYTFIPG